MNIDTQVTTRLWRCEIGSYESVLHTNAETLEWLNQYVRDTPPLFPVVEMRKF